MADAVELMERGWTARRASLSATGGEQEELVLRAREDLEAAVAICREKKTPPELAQALHLLANVEHDIGRDDAAETLREEAVSLCRMVGEPFQLAHKVRHLGDLRRQFGRLEEAAACYDEALQLNRENDDPPMPDFANAANNYAHLKDVMDLPADALALWREARELYGEIDLTAGVDECSKHIERLSG